jgi:hypothetical protein
MSKPEKSDLTKKPFWESKNTSFVEATPACDLLHPEFRDIEPGDSLTETQYLGFNIPEENIHGLCYIWHHPNLKMVTGGAWAWRGVKRHNLACELFDFVTYQSDACLANDLWDYQLDNSYHVNTIEPLKKHRIRYEDPLRENAFDIHLEAIAPAMVLSTGMHLEQAMKTSGWLKLRGKEYPLNGYTVRDRSWGQLRKEGHQPFPPMAWMTCVFNESFMFGCTAFDSPETDPDWKGVLEVPGGQTVKGGWIYKDGEMTPIISAVKKTTRNSVTLFAETVEMTVVDEKQRSFHIKGTMTAAANWKTWHNFDSVICLTRWECDGLVSYGDFQECFWTDYIRFRLG